MKLPHGFRRNAHIAATVAGAYLFLGVFWILLSDRALLPLARNPAHLTELQHYKGWFFVATSSLILFGLILSLLGSVARSHQQVRESEDRFRRLTEANPDAVLVEVNGVYVYANPAAVRLLKVQSATELLGCTSWQFLEPEYHDLVRERHRLSSEEKQSASPLELRIRTANGSLLDIQASCADSEWNGQPAIQMILRDVSEIKQMQESLRQASERLRLAVEGTGECIWDLDVPADRVTLSGKLEGVLESSAPGEGSSPRQWRHLVHPDDAARLRETFRASIDGDSDVYECEYRLKAKDGSWRWVWARGIVVERGKTGKAIALTGTLADITARKDADEQAWRYANLDPLTGMPNRRLFYDRLAGEILKSKRIDNRLAILFIDLDGFKHINDSYGHETGDMLLMEVGRRLKTCVRETDVVARLGGDEFAIALTHLSDIHHAEFVCQKVLTTLSNPFYLGNEVGYISCSIGLSLYPLDGHNSEELIRKADQAMYAAKRSGKNQFHFFTQEMDDKAHSRLRVANELRHALSDGQLYVHYQPVVCLRDGQIAKAEALLRWHHPELGEVDPAEFIPMAEETGLIRQIGNWVFMEAARFCLSCQQSTGKTIQVSVNKSPIQFMARDSDAAWLAYLSQHGLPPDSISIEITEGVLLDASERVVNMLTQYRDAGVQIALDDFGTGYSSLSYLQKFQIDYVKIDQSFVQDITSNPSSRTIAETIVVMAHKLGKQVIAEGVETAAQLNCLTNAGCDYAQGYLFSRPIPGDALVEMLNGGRQRTTLH